ncbi:AMP-binding protein [Streptomyces sp. A1-5]|uniref:AMP-binding protein n=1 Tax=Streptomyces sp. A1-5 TaxID=2738410 RepID=UPI002E2229EE
MTAAPTDAPPFTSYVDTLLTVLARDPDRPVVTTADGQDVTAGTLHATVHRMAAVLRTHGVDRGRTVSVLSRNRPEALAARYAVNLLGARVVLLYEGMAAETLSRMVESAETVLLLVDPDLHDTARALLDGCTGSRPEAMTFGPPPAPPPRSAPTCSPPVPPSPPPRPSPARSAPRTTGASGTPAERPASPRACG